MRAGNDFPTGKALLKLNKTFQVANQEFCFLAKANGE
jgi:hypothetical protein